MAISSANHANVILGPYSQAVAMSVVPKISATLSLIGSTCIVMEVLADHRAVTGNVVKRILLGMSACDLFMSFAWILSTWPSPAEDTIEPFAIGNRQTCTFQGIFLQFGNCATPMYNGALALCYMLKVRYNWKETRLEFLERWIHFFILGIAGGTSLVSLPLTLYNNHMYACWIAEYPLGCKQSYMLNPGEVTDCIRGDNATIYAFAFLNIWIWLSYAVILFSMAMMYQHVSQTERASIFYRRRASMMRIQSHQSKNKNEQTNRVSFSSYLFFNKIESEEEKAIRARMTKTNSLARQAWWYVGAYFLTEIPDTFCSSMFAAVGFYNFWVYIVSYFLNPGQGFANFLVFARTRPEMHYPLSRAMKRIFFFQECTTWRRNSLAKTEDLNVTYQNGELDIDDLELQMDEIKLKTLEYGEEVVEVAEAVCESEGNVD